MAVKSNAFGSTSLTAEDAKKFKDQITYGRPKVAAVESLSRGSDMASAFRGSCRSRSKNNNLPWTKTNSFFAP